MITGCTRSEESNCENPKKEIRKYLKRNYSYKDYIYIVMSNSDNFQGARIPKKFEDIIKVVVNFDKKYDIIFDVFDGYEEYRDCEVEYSHYARHGSSGTEELETLEDVLEYFERMNNNKLNKKLNKFRNKEI
jgi:hypothetical protein